MNRLGILLLIICLSSNMYAQQETLLKGSFESSGFGGPVIKVANVYGETAVIMGGRGGWIINHQFVIGGGAYGLITQIPSQRFDHLEMNLGYGGIEIEYIKKPNKLTHLSFMILFGGGGVGFSDREAENLEENYEYDSFFIAEPSMHLMLNITPFFRAGIGGSYRLISGICSRCELSNEDLTGPVLMITLKFGNF